MNFRFVLRRILLPFIGLIGLFMLIVLSINLSIFDEELSPEVIKISKITKPLKTHNNAFVAIQGLAAASDTNFLQVGEQLAKKAFEKQQANLTFAEMHLTQPVKENLDDEWLKHYKSCNPRTAIDCTGQLIQQVNDSKVISDRLNLMLNRYEQISAMPIYQPYGSVVHFPTANSGYLLKLHQISMALTYNKKDVESFINKLEKNLVFWRNMLNQGSTMLDKMVAVSGIWNDLKFVSELIQNGKTSHDSLYKVSTLLNQLSIEELDISEAFYSEQKELFRLFQSPTTEAIEYFSGSKHLLLNQLIQPNATANAYYEIVVSLMNLSKLSTKELINRKNHCLKKQPDEASHCLLNRTNQATNLSLTNLYNLGGKQLFINTTNNYEDYIFRVHDLNNLFNLINLQLEIKLKENSPIESLIKQSKYKNIFTGEAMQYNADNNWIGFDCLNKQSKCRVNL